jgi:trk system potassium uptake protein TrkH
MLDLSPVVLVIGRITILLGVSMLVLAGVEWENADPNFEGMALSAFLTLTAGLGLTAVTLKRSASGLSRQQAFMLTTLVWVVLPGFGALPLMLGTPGMTLTDAYFEAMSAFTTTGSTVMTGLDTTPEGVLLWRALMQWYGGVGIVVVAIVFLPVLKIGGMQFFRSEGFELQDLCRPDRPVHAGLFRDGHG